MKRLGALWALAVGLAFTPGMDHLAEGEVSEPAGHAQGTGLGASMSNADSQVVVALPELGLQVEFPLGVSGFRPEDRVDRHHWVGELLEVDMSMVIGNVHCMEVSFTTRSSLEKFLRTYNPDPGGDAPDSTHFLLSLRAFDEQQTAFLSGAVPDSFARATLGGRACFSRCAYDYNGGGAFVFVAVTFIDSLRVTVGCFDYADSLRKHVAFDEVCDHLRPGFLTVLGRIAVEPIHVPR